MIFYNEVRFSDFSDLFEYSKKILRNVLRTQNGSFPPKQATL